VVTLLTDFGLEDPFVGILKGVLLREGSELQVVDLTHSVPAQNIEVASFYLERSFAWFPRGSVHLCVVDPGVGSDRAALAAEAHGHWFVAPDNGVLGAVLERDASARVRRLHPETLGLPEPSRTFHGRDVFAPVAAWLAGGRRPFDGLGPLATAIEIPKQPAQRSASGAVGRVITVDHFGNLITNLPAHWLEDADAEVEIGSQKFRVVGTYAEAREGECVALVSSFHTLEVAQRNGNAAQALGVGRGALVRVPLKGPR
jgi:S-adenosylmethionine hydrolase